MSDFVTSVTLLFRDEFSSGFNQASGRIGELRGEIQQYSDDIRSGGMLEMAGHMSMVSMEVGNLARQFQQLTGVPGQIASEFESSMARVSTVLDETNAVGGDAAESMRLIASAARDMAGGVSEAGRIASVGAREFSDSVYTMLSSGLTVEQGIAATEQAALLAQATGGSLQEAASALTGIFNNMGDASADAGDEMRRLSDIVAGTQNYFAFENLNQFTQGFANVSGLAVSAQVPLEQVAAALGQLNTNMITGAQAGTAMKSALAQMSTASERLGFDIARTSDGGIDLMQTLRGIEAAGYASEELIRGFGTEAGPAVSLLTANLSELEAGFAAVQNSAGTTLDNATKMAETLARRQENLNNAWSVFQERIGGGANAVKGLGIQVATTGVQFMNWMSNLPVVGENLTFITGATLQLGGAMAGGFSTVLQMSTGLLSFTMLMEKFGSITGMMRASLSLVGVQFKALGSGILSAGRAVLGFIPQAITWMSTMWGVAAAHIAAAWPIYAVVAAVAAVAAGAVWVFRNWDTVSEFFVNLWEGVKSLFASAWEFVKNVFFTWHPLGIIISNWEPIRGWFAGLWDSIVGLATGAVDRVLAPFRAIKERIQELLPDFLTSGEGLFGAIGSGVAEGGNRLIEGVRGAFSRIGDMLPHSDAKEGPLSTLTASGRAIPETIAEGIRAGNGMTDAARNQFGQLSNVLRFPDGEPVADFSAGRPGESSGIAGMFRELMERVGSRGTEKSAQRPIHIEHLTVQLSDGADLIQLTEELHAALEDAV